MDRRVLQIVKTKLLIVEGKDEELFLTAMLGHLNMDDVQVAEVGGKGNIRPALKEIAKEPAFSKVEALGVIRDADTDPNAAFKSVKAALIAARLPTPKRPLQPVKGTPRVNVMILPSSERKGALEDLCLAAIDEHPVNTCIVEFFNCLKEKATPFPKELSKAKVRVFLSSREDPTLPLGLAAMKGYWPFDNAVFEPMRTFLRWF
ncbi:MAG: DUF3226 domain-containing protein [Thermodesulfobacteriota bacterium]